MAISPEWSKRRLDGLLPIRGKGGRSVVSGGESRQDQEEREAKWKGVEPWVH